jgi:hypothetical protein
MGKPLLGRFSGPKEGGQGSRHGEEDRGEGVEKECACAGRERERECREGERDRWVYKVQGRN